MTDIRRRTLLFTAGALPLGVADAMGARDRAVIAEIASKQSAEEANAAVPWSDNGMPEFLDRAEPLLEGGRYRTKTGETLDVSAPGTGDYNHPETGQGVTPVRSDGRWQLSAWGVTFGLGVSAATLSRNAARVAIAVDHVRRAGGGCIVVPEMVEVDRNFPLPPFVSFDLMSNGGFNNPLEIVENYGRGQVLRMGNFHPDYTEKFTYYPAVTPTYATRALTIPGQGGLFSRGDQVFIATEARGESTGFGIPLYGWLNVVEMVSGDMVIFRHPVDVPNMPLGVARLADETCRDGEPAFFWQDGYIIGGTLSCAAWHITSDSAALDCRVEGVRVISDGAIYGNTFQRMRWLNNDFYFRRLLGEQSHNSLLSTNDGCRFTYIGAPGYGALGVSLQEAARLVTYRNFKIDFGDSSPNSHGLRTIDAQHCVFEDYEVIGRGNAGLSFLQLGSSGYASNINALFRADGNISRRGRILMPTARHARISTSEFSAGQRIEDCGLDGPVASGQSVLVNAGATTQAGQTALRMRDNRIGAGTLAFEGAGAANARLDVAGSPFPVGQDTATLNRVLGRGASPPSFSARRRDFKRSMHNLTLTNGQTDQIPMGNPVGSTSVFKIEGQVSKQGGAKDCALRLRFVNSADEELGGPGGGTASAIIPAANGGAYRIEAEATVNDTGLLLVGRLIRASPSVITPLNVFIASARPEHDIRLRIVYQTGTGPGDEGDSAIGVRYIRTDVQNVYDNMLGG